MKLTTWGARLEAAGVVRVRMCREVRDLWLVTAYGRAEKIVGVREHPDLHEALLSVLRQVGTARPELIQERQDKLADGLGRERKPPSAKQLRLLQVDADNREGILVVIGSWSLRAWASRISSTNIGTISAEWTPSGWQTVASGMLGPRARALGNALAGIR